MVVHYRSISKLVRCLWQLLVETRGQYLLPGNKEVNCPST